MKIVAISDTHCAHERLIIPECDVLVVAGDFTWRGRYMEVVGFAEWIRKQPARHILVVAGNHELTFDQGHRRYDPSAKAVIAQDPFDRIKYLENRSIVIDGVKFYGTPWTPWFHDWAFNGIESNTVPYTNNPRLADIYGRIDDDTNVLICHGPCYGCADVGGADVGGRNIDERLGSLDLLKRTQQLKQLKLTISGHIHEARGYVRLYPDDKLYTNVASLGRDYETIKPPVVIELTEYETEIISGYEEQEQNPTDRSDSL